MTDLILVKVVGKERVNEIGRQCGLTSADQRILFDILGELGYGFSKALEKEKAINRRLRNYPRAIQIKAALTRVIREYVQLNKEYRKQN